MNSFRNSFRSGVCRRSSDQRRSSVADQSAASQSAARVEIIKRLAREHHSHMRAVRHVLDPDSRTVAFCLLLDILITAYNTVVVPLRMGYAVSPGGWGGLFWLDFLGDAFQICDVARGFFTGYYQHGNKVMTRSKVARDFLRSRCFAWSVLALLPFDLIQLGYGRWIVSSRINRLLKLPVASTRLRALAGTP